MAGGRLGRLLWLAFALTLILALFLGFGAFRILILVAGVANGSIQHRVHGGSNRCFVVIVIAIAGCSSIRPGFDEGGIQNRVQRGRNFTVFVRNSCRPGGIRPGIIIIGGGGASGRRSRIRSLKRRLKQSLEGQNGNIVCGSR